MNTRIAGSLFLALIGAALAPAVAQTVRPPAAVETALVEDLDYVFQQRFRSTEGEFFGISRIPVTPEHRRVVHWKPDQKLEKEIAVRLGAEELAAAFLLAKPGAESAANGRSKGLYGAKLEEVPNGRGAISRPILLSSGQPPRALPTTGELLPGIRSSAAAFVKARQHRFNVREWSIVSRPIRAAAECLDCHRKWAGNEQLAEGSVLGIAMYAFAPRR